jgi:hypothetical protein
MKKTAYRYSFTIPEYQGEITVNHMDSEHPDSFYDELAQERAMLNYTNHGVEAKDVILDDCFVVCPDAADIPAYPRPDFEKMTLNDDKFEEYLNGSTYCIKRRSLFDADGSVVNETFEFFDSDNPDDEGMFFTSYLAALRYYGNHVFNDCNYEEQDEDTEQEGN